MCRFACKDPTTCKIARFTVSQVKETTSGGDQFVRDKRVKFFSPPSEDSDSEDECFLPSGPAHLPSIPLPVKQQLPSSPLAPASASSSDSGFADTQANLNEEPDSGVSSQQSTAFSLKSILMGSKAKSLELDDQQSDQQKKRVRFADDHGQSLVQFRSIQSRRVDALFADLVDIGPVEDEAELSPWRAALLRKMSGFVAASSTFTASSSSSTNDESVQR